MNTELDAMSTDDLLRLATAAFVAAMDGVRAHEIHNMTGLTESDCERIAAVRAEVFRRLDHGTLRLPNLSSE